MIPCPMGQYCATTGLSIPTGLCTQGYYCSGASPSATQTICPAGYYCPTGTGDPIPCPAGTFNSATGKFLLNDCISCTAGKYCGSAGLAVESGECPAGYYCPGGQKSQYENICPAGYYCVAGSANKVACSGASQYQDDLGQSTCKTCPAGYKCTDSTIEKCQP